MIALVPGLALLVDVVEKVEDEQRAREGLLRSRRHRIVLRVERRDERLDVVASLRDDTQQQRVPQVSQSLIRHDSKRSTSLTYTEIHLLERKTFSEVKPRKSMSWKE